MVNGKTPRFSQCGWQFYFVFLGNPINEYGAHRYSLTVAPILETVLKASGYSKLNSNDFLLPHGPNHSNSKALPFN